MLNWKSLENQIYLYDGTFNGLLTIVFDCYLSKSIPCGISKDTDYVPSLLEKTTFIKTDENKAKRIWNGICNNISYKALYYAYSAFLSSQNGKEMSILKYILHGFEIGPKIVDYLTLPYVIEVVKLHKKVSSEAHRLKGFVRLSKIGDNLWYAPISPDNNVIEEVGHFLMKRFPNQNIILHDKNRNLAFLYSEKARNNYEIIEVSNNYNLPDFSKEEIKFQTLWKSFYKTIAIKERTNKRLQMQYMPKKYWKDITEMSQ